MRLVRLQRLLSQHRGPLRADMRRVYGIDLDQVLEDQSIKPLVLADLIDHLPLDAALWRAINPDVEWGRTDMLLAEIVDNLAMLNWMTLVINSKKGTRIPAPTRIPRPGVKPELPDEGVETIGASEGFDSPEDFDAWYAHKRG